MSTLCQRAISTGQTFNCDLIGGVENNYYVFNRDDIAAYIRDMDNNQIITDFTMNIVTPAVTGPPAVPAVYATGYLFQGFNTSTKPKTVITKKTYAVRYTQTIDAVIFDRGSDVKVQLEALALAQVVIIVENKLKTEDCAFEVYGLDVGLQLLALTDDPTNADTEGAYVVQWSSPADFQEPHLPATFFDTSYAVTKAAILSLLQTNQA